MENNENSVLDEETKKLINRLSRAEGQIRGVQRLVQSNAPCEDVLMQLSAAQAALNGFAKEYLERYIKTEFRSDLKEKSEAAALFSKMLIKFLK